MVTFVMFACLGGMASVPVACATWAALGPGRHLRRALNAMAPLAAPVAPLMLLSHGGDPLGHLFFPSIAVGMYLVCLAAYATLRRAGGWHFEMMSASPIRLTASGLRYSINDALAATAVVSALATAWVVVDKSEVSAPRLGVAFLIVIVCCGLLPHLAVAKFLGVSQRFYRGAVLALASTGASLVASKLLWGDEQDSEPFVISTVEDVGGFAFGLVCVQAVYAVWLSAMGYELVANTADRRPNLRAEARQ